MNGPVDPACCDKEPIHTPGAIQPHGVLFALDDTLGITHVSESASQWLGRAADTTLGSKIVDIVGAASKEELGNILLSPRLPEYNPISATLGDSPFDLIGHRHKGRLIIELEPTTGIRPIGSVSAYHRVRSSLMRMRQSENLHELCQAAAQEVRRLTGFERVLVYRFEKDWSGEVVAEARNESPQSFLGMHFPASDIPAQARALYELNTLRIIPNVDYTPSRILTHDASSAPLDLSLSVLRSVSPVHIQYMRNMGLRSSMSISIVQDGRLWGMISCSNESAPRGVSFALRTTCDFLAESMSLLIESKQGRDDMQARQQSQRVMTQLLHQMTADADVVSGLTRHDVNVASMVQAQGAAVLVNQRLVSVGRTPSEADVQELARWLNEQQSSPLFVTDSLPHLFPRAERYRDVACGLMSAQLSASKGNYILWFRPEVLQTVTWGGNPHKVATLDGTSLSPRTSFARWKEQVNNKSLSWLEHEREAADELMRSVIDIVLQSSEELSVLNAELERSNVELDAFAYAASHDLKEPLRGIHNYTALTLRELGDDHLVGESRERLDTVLRLTQRMERLIDSLLRYAHVGRTEMEMKAVDLRKLIDTTLEMMQTRIVEKRARITVSTELPKVRGDTVLLGEVFSNLFSNAIKYNDSGAPRIDVGASVEDGRVVVTIRDNGIGIRDKNHDAVFKIFRRLHGRDRYGGGTGTGLTIARRIVERHGGQLWLNSTVGVGSTFSFSIGLADGP